MHNDKGEDVCCYPECEAPADTALAYCTVCGYDIVQQAKVDLTSIRPVTFRYGSRAPPGRELPRPPAAPAPGPGVCPHGGLHRAVLPQPFACARPSYGSHLGTVNGAREGPRTAPAPTRRASGSGRLD